jgi:opacity protein-like surface antigen
MKKFFIAVFLLSLIASPAAARPVSYADGWTVMQMNDGENNTLHTHYSPTARYSVGYLADYWREGDWWLHALQVNWLAKRWNESDLQANLYVKSGLGVALADEEDFEDETQLAGFVGAAFDAENRRYYFSYENRWTDAGEIHAAFQQKSRVGIAPYIAEYGSIHTWIMLQVDHRPEADDPLVFTPMLRFFKGDSMLEVGLSDSEEMLFNFVQRF